MRWAAKFRSWKRQLFDQSRLDDELDAEVQAYTNLLIDDYIRAGMSPEEARRTARREVGSPALLKEQCRDVRAFHWWDDLKRDLRYGLRQLGRNPLMTAAIVATLALGIGANVMIFSVVRAVVLRPLAYKKPAQLVQLWQSNLRTGTETDWVSFPDFRDWNRQNRAFESMAAYKYQIFTVTENQVPESVFGLEVTDRLFTVLGVQPIHGRTFSAEESAVAVISHSLWKSRFGGDPGISSRSAAIDGKPYQIVGVMPPGFRFPNFLPSDSIVASIDLWIPMRTTPDLEARDSRNYWAIGRLKSDVTVEQARADMESIAANISREYPGTNRDVGVKVGAMQDYVTRGLRSPLMILLGAVGMLLLLACSNIANLLLSRAESRRREMAIRLAIGAGRGRLLRQALTESLLISFIGASVGVVIAYFGSGLMLKLAPLNVPRIDQTSIDAQVLGFAFVVAVGAGILFGLMPALLGRSSGAYHSLKEAGVRSTSSKANLAVRHMLMAGQMALAVVLLTSAGLLIRSFVNVVRLDLGFQTNQLLIGFVNLSQPQYADQTNQALYFERVLDRIRSLPGVAFAAVSNSVPLTGVNDQGSLAVEGFVVRAGEESPRANRPSVSTGYFEAMSIPLITGRQFDERDRADSPYVAIVSDLAARTYWPGGSPIGKRISVNRARGERVWREVVGVVASTRHFGLEAAQRPEVYLPHTQRASPFMALVVRTKGNPQDIVRACLREMAVIDAHQSVFGFGSMDHVLSNAQARRRFQSSLLAGFAGAALLLAAVGIYGVIAYSVAQRTREIGTRIALGASARTIVIMILKQGLGVTFAGTVVGVIGAIALSRVLSGLLFGVSALHLPTFGIALVVLLSVATLSTYLPSRRAAKLDPLTALREE